VVYRVDDGTGVIDCWKYYDANSSNSLKSFALGDFLSVKGLLTMHQGSSGPSSIVLMVCREIFLATSCIQLSKNINMEALHIVTVLKRDKVERLGQRVDRMRVPPTNAIPPTLIDASETYHLATMLESTSLSWIQHISSLCSCQYLNPQSGPPESALLSQFLFCSCLSKYSHLDPDGCVRIRILSYLLRIQSALSTELSRSNSLHLQDLMCVSRSSYRLSN
jgi:hypothetical protein